MKYIIIFLLFPIPAFAQCVASNVCDDYGCSVIDVCDDSLDIPSYNVPSIPQIRTSDVKPLDSIGIPPIGTTDCEYMIVNGQWKNVCY